MHPQYLRCNFGKHSQCDTRCIQARSSPEASIEIQEMDLPVILNAGQKTRGSKKEAMKERERDRENNVKIFTSALQTLKGSDATSLNTQR